MYPALKAAVASTCLMLLTACDSSSVSQQQTTPAEGESLLDRILITGYDSGDNEAHWLCDITNGQLQENNFTLQFWNTKHGVAGGKTLQWNMVGESVELTLDHGTTRLTELQFDRKDSQATHFTARSDWGDQLNCHYQGPPRSNNLFFADAPDPENMKFQTDENNPDDFWRCHTYSDAGSVSENIFRFWSPGTGEMNGIEMTWFINHDSNLNISLSEDFLELEDLAFPSQPQDLNDTTDSFTASIRGDSLTCLRTL